MNTFWDVRFDELARFNTDSEKSKYNEEYLRSMAKMQKEFNEKQALWAKENSYKIFE